MENKNKNDAINKGIFSLTAKAVVLNGKDEVLLIKRHKDDHHGAGKWDLPGGNLEPEENVIEGIEREIKEEIGVEVKIETVLLIHDFEKKYNREIKINGRSDMLNGKGIRLLAYCDANEIELSHEHEEYEWVSLKEAADKFGKTDFEMDKVAAIEAAQRFLEMKRAEESMKRLAADFENYKKRASQERKEMIAFSNAQLMAEIIPVLDNFHASTDHIPEDQKDGAWVIGIMHIQNQLEKVLEDNGVLEIPVKAGDEFDPMIMEALQNGEGKENMENRVEKVVQKGYKIGGKVLRAARVIVN